MDQEGWRPISIDCIDGAGFPDVCLYLRSCGKYVLYKDKATPLCDEDRVRLTGLSDFLYVQAVDLREINRYLEANLTDVLASKELDGVAKGKILYQTSVNIIVEVFDSPESAASLERCRSLIRHMMQYIASDREALEALRSVVNHDFYLFAHSVRVTALNLLVHEKLFNLSRDEMTDVGIGSMLHDFGMTFVSMEIIERPQGLDPQDVETVREHAQRGYDYLRDVCGLSEVALTVIRHHHERADGSGYPCGIRGDSIPRSAQLAAICDVYSALTMDRSYRKAFSQEQALQLMAEQAEQGLFSPYLFAKFAELLRAVKHVSTQERDQLLA